jgi:hypothetical protein
MNLTILLCQLFNYVFFQFSVLNFIEILEEPIHKVVAAMCKLKIFLAHGSVCGKSFKLCKSMETFLNYLQISQVKI